MDILRAYWDALPAYLRTVVNVALGAALAGAVGYLGGVVNGEPFDVNAFVGVVVTGICTAVVRALNPLDTVYGTGSGAGD